MAINYTNTHPDWNNEGTEPTEELKQSGFTAGYKPPSDYFNWFWSKVGKCIKELQEKLSSVGDNTILIQNRDRGFAGGTDASALGGGAVGSSSKATNGGAVGQKATAQYGGAVGSFAQATNGGAVGNSSQATYGGAVGYDTTAEYGGAVGSSAQATNGGAIGWNALASNGFAGGYNAKTKNGDTLIDAIQLGTGTNPNEKTLQVYDYQLMDASGNIPKERIANAVSDKADKTHTHTLDYISETTSKKIMTATERTKLNGIAENANNYVHPDTHPASMITGFSDAVKSCTDSTVTETGEMPISGSAVYTKLSSKMDKENAVGTGSFSIARKSGTDVGFCSVVIGGNGNAATNTDSTAIGGRDNTAGSGESVVIGGNTNTATDEAPNGTIIGGYQNTVSQPNGTIVGGHNNGVDSDGTIVGGADNYVTVGVIVGGNDNLSSASNAAVIGGKTNRAEAASAGVLAGEYNKALGSCSVALGGGKQFSSDTATEETGNVANGVSSAVIGGHSNEASAELSAVIGGNGNTAGGSFSIVFGGYDNTASGDYTSVISGSGNTTYGSKSCIIGGETNETVGAKAVVLGGKNNKAKGANSIVGGWNNVTGGSQSTYTGNYQTIFGKFANMQTTTAEASASSTDGTAFVIGNGTADTSRSNVFRASYDGKCRGLSSFIASGADFAEMFEWADSNAEKEDRRGLFVTLDGDKIRLANADDDFILGIVSSVPTIVGDTQSETWHGMYLKDVFGEPLKETVTVEEYTDENGNVVPEHTETRPIINPEYDPEKPYVGRDERHTHSAVGIVGKLVTVDDGTCEVNGYCKVSNNGIATKSDERTLYRVIARLDDTHIKVLII